MLERTFLQRSNPYIMIKTSKLERFINNHHFQQIMLFCLFGYVLFKESNRYIGDIFQSCIVVGSLLAIYVYRKYFFQDKIFLSLIASIIVSILSWTNSIVSDPSLAKSSPNIGFLGNLFFFIMIAYWLKADLKNTRTFLFLFLIGLLMTLFTHSSDIVLDIYNGFNGERVDFDFINANHSAALAGCAILLTSYYAIKTIKSNCSFKSKLLSVFLYLLITSPFIFIAIVTKARQVWLAIFLILILYIGYEIIKGGSFKKKIAIILSFLITISLVSKIPVIEERINTESAVFSAISTGQIDTLPYTSIGTRLHFWSEAIPWIEKYPILGFGEDTRNLVIKESPNIPEKVKASFSHLHNGHIEILVSYGLLGFSLLMFVCITLIKSAYSVRDFDQGESYYLILIFITYFIIINMFESFWLFKTGLYMFTIFCAAAYSLYLTSSIKRFYNEK
ncbi:O-antigen ligase family protein [Aliivibrio fischeri]|uniref:O-antigen ligase family protein n=1 Tax=Aliivibrio fischeri TaxID=668 RepID=UPI00159F2023|nr:O-antigen ligase family protein [Aliivibrio fischeri]